MKDNTQEMAAHKLGATKIVFATVAALVVAALILTILILPAEFNRDPLGVGEMLGIKGLSQTVIVETVTREKAEYGADAVSFQLLPFEFVEYKYRLNKGSTMLYNWTASDTVSFDFHGEPVDGPEGFSESFSLGKADRENGTFTAPFSGIHGWFWENRGAHPVTVKLTTAGFYTATLEFRDGFVNEKKISGEGLGKDVP